jgi:electron transport complex protein RnfG
VSGEDQTIGSEPAVPSAQQEVPPWRLVSTLGTAGALAGFLIVFVFVATEPTIKAHKAMVLRQAIQEVLKGPASFDTLFVYDGALTAELPAGQDPESMDQIYVGYGDDGSQVGFAMVAAEPGFQDIVQLIFGYEAGSQRVIGMKVLESLETPGLGDKIEKDQSFVREFDGVTSPLVGVKPGRATGDEHEIDMITGATISSRAVIKIINNAIERYSPLIAAHNGGGVQ